jgi:hypothetical protein
MIKKRTGMVICYLLMMLGILLVMGTMTVHAEKKTPIDVKVVFTIENKVVPASGINETSSEFLKAVYTTKLVAADGTEASQKIIDNAGAHLVLDTDSIKNPLTFSGLSSEGYSFDSAIPSLLNQYTIECTNENAVPAGCYLNYWYEREEMPKIGTDFEANHPLFSDNSDKTVPDSLKQESLVSTAESYIQSCLKYRLPSTVSGHDAVFGTSEEAYGAWLIFTAARAGYSPHDGFNAECYAAFEEKYKDSGKVNSNGKPLNEGFDANEVAKDALAITAIGFDARNVAGYNLIEMLTNGKNPSDGYFVKQVSAFAINSYNYLPGQEDAYIHELAEKALAGSVTHSDPLIDMYVMEFQPLAAYYDPKAQTGDKFYDVKQVMEQVLIPYFQVHQGYTGLFYNGISYNNPWSNAQSFITLGMGKVNIFQQNFIKNGYTFLNILPAKTESFSADEGQIARGYEALVRSYRDENQIFDCTDVLNSTVKVNNAIMTLPDADTITSNNREAALTALNDVDTLLKSLSLTESQKNSVEMTKYNALKTKLAGVIPSEADKAAAQVVTDQIAKLAAADKLAKKDEPAVTAARSAYTALTDNQRGLVTNLDVLIAAETAIKALGPDTSVVTIDVERFTIGQGFLKEPITMNCTKDETVYDLISRLLGAENIVGSSAYISGIKGSDAGEKNVVIPDYIVDKLGGGNTAAAKSFGNALTDSALGTSSYSQQGGWMFLVNNKILDVGMGDYHVKDGDVIRIAFSYCGYGADLTGYEYGATEQKVVIANRDELLKTIAAINIDEKEKMLANVQVKTAYDNAMSTAQDMGATSINIKKAVDDLNQAVDNFKKTDNKVNCIYQTHVENIGWQAARTNGEISGTTAQSLRLEGIKISLDTDADLGIQYKTHIQNLGWENAWKENGSKSGTEGYALRLEAIKIELTGADKDKYDVYYQVHAQNIGWMTWAKNGENAGTAGFSYRLEGIKIVVVPKGEAAPATTIDNVQPFISNNQ